jgi:hypothetical protein
MPARATRELARLASTMASRAASRLATSPVLRDALLAWLGQRGLLLTLVTLFQALTSHPTIQSVYRVWTLWDGALYAWIARSGYQTFPQAAFYPLFPLLEHLLAPLVGGSTELAGVVIANAASLGAFALLRMLVEQDLGRPIARRTLLYLVLFPTSMFFAAAYTESLFLLLSVGTFLALRKRAWLLAGALAALATLTRTTGLVLLLPFAVAAYATLQGRWSAIAWRERWRALAPIGGGALVPIVAYAALQLALDLHFGVADAQGRSEAQNWGRHLDWPWVGLLRSLAMVLAHFPSVAGMDLLFALLWLGLAGSMLWPSARSLPLGYVVYAWASLLLVLAAPLHLAGESPLASISRYMLVSFPCTVRLAQISTRSRWLHYAMLAATICQLVALTWLFAQGKFVA